jgi:hypothetical protein
MTAPRSSSPTVLDLFGPESSGMPAIREPVAFAVDTTRSALEQSRLQFEAFHSANPHVYAILREFALQLVRSGRRKIGIRMVWERMRWEMAIRTTTDDYKLNDHYTRWYARVLMEREPELRGVFETRTRRDSEES